MPGRGRRHRGGQSAERDRDREQRAADEHGRRSHQAPGAGFVRARSQREPDERGGRDGEEDLDFRQEREADEKPERRDPDRPAALEPACEHEQRGEREQRSVRRLVRIRADVVRVPDRLELREGEERQEDDESGRGGEVPSDPRDEAMEEPRDACEDGQVRDDEREEARAEHAEDGGVDIRRERSGEVRDVAVEHVALRQTPRDVELAAEIDEHVRPRAPGPHEHRREDGDAEERARGLAHQEPSAREVLTLASRITSSREASSSAGPSAAGASRSC